VDFQSESKGLATSDLKIDQYILDFLSKRRDSRVLKKPRKHSAGEEENSSFIYLSSERPEGRGV